MTILFLDSISRYNIVLGESRTGLHDSDSLRNVNIVFKGYGLCSMHYNISIQYLKIYIILLFKKTILFIIPYYFTIHSIS